MTLLATFQSLMTSRGYIQGASNVNYNLNSLVEWSDIYLQILDQYERKCVVIRVFVILISIDVDSWSNKFVIKTV